MNLHEYLLFSGPDWHRLIQCCSPYENDQIHESAVELPEGYNKKINQQKQPEFIAIMFRKSLQSNFI